MKSLFVIALLGSSLAMAADEKENKKHKSAPIDRLWDAFYQKDDQPKPEKQGDENEERAEKKSKKSK